MQAVGLAAAVFFGIIGAVTVIEGISKWLYRSKYLAQVKVTVLSDSEDCTAYTVRAVKKLAKEGRLKLAAIEICRRGGEDSGNDTAEYGTKL